MKKHWFIALLSALVLTTLLVMVFSLDAQGTTQARPASAVISPQISLIHLNADISAEFDPIPTAQYLNVPFTITVTLQDSSGAIFPWTGDLRIQGYDSEDHVIWWPQPTIRIQQGRGSRLMVFDSLPGGYHEPPGYAEVAIYAAHVLGDDETIILGHSNTFKVLPEIQQILMRVLKSPYENRWKWVQNPGFWGDVTISGQVTDLKTGNPVAGADVFVENGALPAMTRTDNLGRYLIQTTVPYGEGAGNLHHDFQLRGLLDLQISDVEVTQVIQCLDENRGDLECKDNSIPLIQGKPTVVRVFYDVPNATVSWPISPTAKITMISPTSATITKPYPERIPFIVSFERENINHSFNFQLPLTWTLVPEIEIEIEINPDLASPESNYTNNTKSMTLLFHSSPNLTVRYVPIRYQPCIGSPCPKEPTDRIRSAATLAQKLYPISSIHFEYLRGPLVLFEKIYLESPNEKQREEGVSMLMALLNKYYNAPLLLGDPNPPDQLIGWLPDLPKLEIAGSSDPLWASPRGQGRVTFAQDWQVGAMYMGPSLLAHEIAHNFGRRHPNTVDSCDAKDATTDWPGERYYFHARILEPGFDIMANGGLGAVVARSKKDVMTYCGNPGPPGDGPEGVWISPFTYSKLHASSMQPQISAQNRTTPHDVLMISGRIAIDGSGELATGYRFDTMYEPASLQSDGQFCLDRVDQAGQTLKSDCFDVDYLDHYNEPMDAEWFLFLLDLPESTHRLVLRDGERVLDELVASDNAPTLTVLSPVSGKQWDSVQTIRWTASDADEDELVSAIFYSPDQGNSWWPLAFDLTETSLEIDTSDLPGGEEALVRVAASDGMNMTSVDISPLNVSRKAPEPLILKPEDNARYLPGWPVYFWGGGDDLEDGALDQATMSWRSNIDGYLGSGAFLQTEGLSQGVHVITLTARDSENNQSSDSITLVVEGLPHYLPLTMHPLKAASQATPTPTTTPSPQFTPTPTSTGSPIPVTPTATSIPTDTPTITPTQVAPVPPPADCTWVDDFNGGTLEPGWNWIRENPTHWSLTAHPGFLRITSQKGDLLFANDMNNLLMRAAPAGDFEMITRIAFDPVQSKQEAMLLMYENDDRYVKAGRYRDEGSTFHDEGVDFGVEEFGQLTYSTKPTDLAVTYLELIKNGSTYSAYFSADGSSWSEIGTRPYIGVQAPYIGLGVWHDQHASELAADFDWICVKSASGPTPSPSATPTATLTPTLTPEVPAITLAGVGTTNDADLLRMGFIPDSPIKFWLRVHNASATEQDFTANVELYDPGGSKIDALSWTGVLTNDPGTTNWTLTRTLPAVAAVGQYTYKGTVTYHDQTTSASVVFYVAESVALTDDFSNEQSGWPINQTSNYKVGYIENEYQIQITAPARLVRATTNLTLDGGLFEVEAHNTGAIRGDYGLLFGLSDDNLSFYVFLISSTGKYGIFLHTPEGWDTIQPWTSADWLSTGNGSNHIMSAHNQNQISVYANGVHLSTVPTGSLATGRAGLIAQSNESAGVDIRFDNYAAYRLSYASGGRETAKGTRELPDSMESPAYRGP